MKEEGSPRLTPRGATPARIESWKQAVQEYVEHQKHVTMLLTSDPVTASYHYAHVDAANYILALWRIHCEQE